MLVCVNVLIFVLFNFEGRDEHNYKCLTQFYKFLQMILFYYLLNLLISILNDNL
jgi:hypothetical protein